VTDWGAGFLGIIAASTAVMALIQIGAIVMAARVAKQAQQTLDSVQRDIRPLLVKVNAIADEAARTATLAREQVQKVDRVLTDLSRRVDETTAIVQHAIVTPAREGMAIVAAVKAGLLALRGLAELRRGPARTEDEESLFIG
jgi:hypothetical protein